MLMLKKFKSFFNKPKGKGKKRKIIISAGLAWGLVFGQAQAKDNGFLPGAEAFPTPPLSRPTSNNRGYFATSSGSGSPKKGPNGNSDPSVNFNAKPKSAHQIKPQSWVPTSQNNQNKKKKSSTKKISGFEFILDKNGNPILLVENENGTRTFVEYDQVLNKYYHHDVFGLNAPKNFDASYAQSLPLKEKLEYLKKKQCQKKMS